MTCFDPDAPTGSGFWHWLVVNIPPDGSELAVDAGNPKNPKLPPGALQTRTDGACQYCGVKIEDKAPGADSSVQSRETRELVHNALQKLSPELREAVILRDLQDMDYKDIATVLKVPEGTVKSRINRGRAELARLLQRTYRQVM